MATYCTDSQLTDKLPPNLPADVDIASERATYITQASDLFDGLVGPSFSQSLYGSVYQKFPDVTSDPATPAAVQDAVAWLAAGALLDHIHVNQRSPISGTERTEIAELLIEKIAEGITDVVDSAGNQYGARTSSLLTSTTSAGVPRFTIGTYDRNGYLTSDDPGSLDDR